MNCLFSELAIVNCKFGCKFGHQSGNAFPGPGANKNKTKNKTTKQNKTTQNKHIKNTDVAFVFDGPGSRPL